MMPYQEDIESFCSVTYRQVTLTLTTQTEPTGATITGKPVKCNHEGTLMVKKENQPWTTCQDAARCMLKTSQVTTRRK
jgi:hypothetical protein